jgi:hypothetical protein
MEGSFNRGGVASCMMICYGIVVCPDQTESLPEFHAIEASGNGRAVGSQIPINSPLCTTILI